jgi:hypothetical protein
LCSSFRRNGSSKTKHQVLAVFSGMVRIWQIVWLQNTRAFPPRIAP